MQINFKAKKLQEAHEYVNLLNPSTMKKGNEITKKQEPSLLKKMLKFLFK